MEEEKYSYATLKNEKGRMVYPKTRAEQVKYYDPDKKHLVTQSDINDELKPLIPKTNDMESRLKSVEELTQSLKDNLKFKGVVDSEDKLPVPAEGENADGWFAIVTVSKGKDKWYIYDTEEGWLDKGEATTYIYEGVKVLNGKEPVEGALVINASDIAASINGESKTIQEVLTSLSNEQDTLANEVRTKNHVLYMTEYQMEQVDEIQEGQIVVCVEDGVYEKGATYKLVSGVWEKMIAVANVAQHLYGTLQEPIILMDLEDGEYIIHDYFKISSNSVSNLYAIIDYKSFDNLPMASSEILTSAKVTVKKEIGIEWQGEVESKTVIFKDYFYHGYQRIDNLGVYWIVSMCGGPGKYDSVPKTSAFYINNYKSTLGTEGEINYNNFIGIYGDVFSDVTSKALSTDNTTPYTPTADYHPATKEYVDNAKPIQVVSDVETEANGINMFSTNREAGENSRLFMNKEVTEFVSFPRDELIYKPYVKVDESILDVVLPDGVILASTHLYGYFYEEDKTTRSPISVSLKVYFTNKKVSRVSWVCNSTEKNVYYKEQWTNEPILLNINSMVSVDKYPYIKIETPEEGTVNALIKDYVLLEQKTLVKEEVALMRAIGSGGTTITDTLTLSKEVFVPEVPEIPEITISRMENPEAPEGMLPNNGFTLGDDGYYVNLNSYGSSTYSMCKIFFDVKEERDFILDVIYEGEAACDFPMFGKIDTMLEFSDGWEYEENNDLLQESFREKGPYFDGEVVYKNVPAGDHFIVVKYINDGGTQWNSDTVKFKSSEKNKGQEFVEGYHYTSQQEIKIGDHNNLQIEGKDILKDGDFEIPFKTIVGTEENPIMLLNLEKGSYKMSGWVQCSPNVEKGPIYTYNYMGEKANIDAYVIVYPEISPDYKLIYIFNGNFSNYGIEISNYNYYNTLVGSYVVVNEWGYGGGTTLDFGSYAQNWQLSEIQTQVTEKINSYRPIEEIDNPSDKNELEDKNKIFINSNLEDNSLYFTKVINKEEEEKEVNAGEPIKSLVLNKNIINAKPNTTDSFQASILQYDLFSDANCNNLLAGGLTIDIVLENGEITRVVDTWIGLDLYNKDNGWVPTGNNTDENEFNLTNYFHFQHFSHVNKIYVKIANIFTDYINTNDYLKDKIINYKFRTLKSRSASRFWSFFAISSRLSYNFLPFARPISTFTRLPFK